jgi:hypothetical protein
MLKTALVATLVASTAALSQEETRKALSAIHQKAHTKVEEVKHNSHHSANLANAAKSLKLSSSVSLKASGITSKLSVRSLRGKAGKGKGRGKDDEDEDEEEDVVVPVARTYMQIQLGLCAGFDFGDGFPTAEDFYFETIGFAPNVCFDSVTDEGIAMSSLIVAVVEPFSAVKKIFQSHGCMASYYMPDYDDDATAGFSFDGAITANGVCTDTGLGISAALSFTDAPTLSSATPTIFSSSNGKVNDCMGAASGQAGYGFDVFEVSEVGMTFGGIWYSSCNEEYDENDEPTGVYTMYDTSACGATPSVITENFYSDDVCTVLTGSESLEADFCRFDWEYFNEELTSSGGEPVDFVYDINTCHPGTVA